MSKVMRISKRNAYLVIASPLIVALNMSVSQVAMAACTANPTLSVGIVCADGNNNSTSFDIVNGNNLAKFAPGLASLFANSSINTNFTPATAIQVSNILVTNPLGGSATFTNTGEISNSISNQKIKDNAVRTTTTTSVHVPPGGFPPNSVAGTTTFAGTDKDGAIVPVSRAASPAEIAALPANAVITNNPGGSKDYVRTSASAVTSSSNVANLIGINADDAGEYRITNAGKITISHAGVGQAYGIAANGDVEAMEIINKGDISVTRHDVVVTQMRSNAIQGRPSDTAATVGTIPNATLAVAAGIFAEEEPESLSIENQGSIHVSGNLAAGIYSRAGAFSLINDGEIEHAAGRGLGIAIAAVSDGGELRTAFIENTKDGEIEGDVVLTNGHALRWWGLASGNFQALQLNNSAVQNDYLQIGSQFGQLDTTFINEGTVKGNFYYSNGAHSLFNSGTMESNLNIDQRDTLVTGQTCTRGVGNCFALSASVGTAVQGIPNSEEATVNSASKVTSTAPTVVTANTDLQIAGSSTPTATYEATIWGSKEFYFENNGTFTGDFVVRSQAAGTVYGFTTTGSSITIAPHIYGGGADNKADAHTTADGLAASKYINGELKIWNGSSSTIDDNTTIAPVIDGMVRTGEWYTVATKLYQNDLPNEISGSALVTWEAAKDGTALVIGATVADANTITGISGPAAATINGLMGTDGSNDDVNELAAAVQGLTDEDDVRKAGKQLSPETNFATQQQALTLSFLAGQNIDNRLASVGAAGAPPAAGFAPPSGLGMSESEPAPSNRMSLGAYSEETVPSARERGGLWGQGFGSNLQQDEKAGVDGYDAKIYGALAGIDNWVSPSLRLGVAVGYARSTIDGDGDTSLNSTDVDSYMALGYASVKGSGWYVSSRAGYTLHQYDSARHLIVPLRDTATGSHDGDQYTAAAEFGAPMRILGNTLTPVASLTYNNLQQEGYAEAGGGMALKIGDQDTQSLSSGLGIKALIPIAGDTLLEGRAIWLHEFEDTNQEVTANFSGGSSFAVAGPDVGRDTAALGVGLLAYTTPGVSFQMNYDALVREEFIAHAGSGRVRVEF